jgi:hypothetical protein
MAVAGLTEWPGAEEDADFEEQLRNELAAMPSGPVHEASAPELLTESSACAWAAILRRLAPRRARPLSRRPCPPAPAVDFDDASGTHGAPSARSSHDEPSAMRMFRSALAKRDAVLSGFTTALRDLRQLANTALRRTTDDAVCHSDVAAAVAAYVSPRAAGSEASSTPGRQAPCRAAATPAIDQQAESTLLPRDTPVPEAAAAMSVASDEGCVAAHASTQAADEPPSHASTQAADEPPAPTHDAEAVRSEDWLQPAAGEQAATQHSAGREPGAAAQRAAAEQVAAQQAAAAAALALQAERQLLQAQLDAQVRGQRSSFEAQPPPLQCRLNTAFHRAV